MPDAAVREDAAVQADRERTREAGEDDYDCAEQRQGFASDRERRGVG